MKKLLTFLMFFLLATAMAQMQAATKTVTYTVESTSSVKVSGTPPSTTATDPAYSSTYTAAKQLTGGNSMQLTLYGFSGKKITGITLSMRSNSSAGAGYFSMKAGSTTLASIGSTNSGVKFNDAKWNGSWSTSYTDVTPQMTNNSYVIQQAENVVILIGATANSLYCQSFTIAYEEGGSAPSYNVNVASGIVGGTVTASPTSAKEGDEVTLTATPASGYEFGSWNVTNASTSATITVTNNKFKMPAANVNVSATFNANTPVGNHTFDFTEIADFSDWTTGYSEHTITNSYGTVTLASANRNTSTITDMPVTKGGDVTFVAAAGKTIKSLTFTCAQWTTKAQTITLNVSTNGGSTWKSTSTTSSNFVLTAASLPENVNAVKFTFSSTSNQVGIKYLDLVLDSDTPTPSKTSTTTAFSAEAKAGVTKTVGDADFTEAATLTPAEAGSLTYSSSNTGVATVNATTGVVHIVGVGTTTIKAEFAETDDYKASSDSYTLTVNAATLTSIAISGTPTKTEYKVGEAFSTEGLTVTGTYSNGNSAPITEGIVWTFEPATLAATTTSVAVTATVDGKSANQTYTVSVSKKDASVAIENVEVEVGKTATISATTTPADAELTYTITEGADKISIADGVITGVAEGTATVKAAFAGNDEFNSAETTFTVNVTPPCVVTTLSKDGDIKFVTGTSSATNAFWANSTPLTANGLTLSGSNNSASNYSYFDGSVVRFYQNNSFTITPDDGVTITKIEIIRQTSTSSNSGVINCDVLTASGNNTTTNTNVYTGPTTSAVTFTAAAQARFTAVKVYTEPTAPVGTLDHIEVVEGYKAEYTDGDAFEKATVMAYYEEEGVEPVNVTNKATFSGYDLSAETSGEQTVNVSYTEGEVTKTTSYPINFTAVTKRTVTIVPPVNGQLKVVVKATGAEIATGARVADGTVLKITNTPDEGYVLRKIVVTDTEKHNYTAQDKEITVNGIDVTINAIFIKGDNFTYTWSVNGQVASQDVYVAGATVTAPAVTAAGPDGKTFVGWSRTATVDADNCTLATVDPTAVTDRTYFAVFAKAETSGDGGETYYEEVPTTYVKADWLSGEYIIVNEDNLKSTARVFNGLASDGTQNVCTSTATITKEGEKYVIKTLPDGAAKITFEEFNASHLRARINGQDLFITSKDNGGNGLNVLTDGEIRDTQKRSVQVANLDISYHGQAPTGHWDAILNGNYLSYNQSSGFRAYTSEQTLKVNFYVKKNAGTTTYSEYTTGMTVDPHDFQLVTSDDDLVAGREYIIVSKFINDDNSRTIYGLSVDNADSRTENGKEGTSKTTTNFRRGETGVTFSHGDYFASIDNKISVLALEGEEGAWAFNSAAGYLKGGKETEAFLRINSNRANATISKDNLDVATIIYKVVKDGEEVDGTREVFLNINGGYPRYGAYAHNNLTDTDKKFNYAASYLYWREALNEESLAEIEANGISGTEYTVIDDLVVAYVDENKKVAWAHDMAKSYAYRENTYDATWYGGYGADSYTQHNWVKLDFTNTKVNDASVDVAELQNQKLSNVFGTYTGHKGVSHEIAVTSFDSSTTDVSEKANEYIMASFWDDNTYDYVEAKGKKFFLMNPKIEEVCNITEAVWNGTGFVMPEAGQEFTTKNENGTDGPTIHLNTYDLKGGAAVDWKYNKTGTPTQIGEDRYRFLAVVTKKASAPTTGGAGAGAPAKVAPSNCGLSDYVIYPLDFAVNHIVTDVKDVNVAGREVKSVRYYDVAGRSYGEAQPGINIVVTEYTDGSHSAAKMVR